MKASVIHVGVMSILLSAALVPATLAQLTGPPLRNRTQAALYAVRSGFVSDDSGTRGIGGGMPPDGR
jgi:hypothetical protein